MHLDENRPKKNQQKEFAKMTKKYDSLKESCQTAKRVTQQITEWRKPLILCTKVHTHISVENMLWSKSQTALMLQSYNIYWAAEGRGEMSIFLFVEERREGDNWIVEEGDTCEI